MIYDQERKQDPLRHYNMSEKFNLSKTKYILKIRHETVCSPAYISTFLPKQTGHG